MNDKVIVSNYSLVLSRKPKSSEEKMHEALVEEVLQIANAHGLPKGYVCVIEAAHTGVPNAKNIIYMSKGMDEAVKTYYTPSWKPLMFNHKTASDFSSFFYDSNSYPIGRIIKAEFRKSKVETPNGVGDGCIVVGAYIPETASLPDGTRVIDALKSRQLMHVSIGAYFPRDKVRCTICGKNPLEAASSEKSAPCDHVPGMVYDGKKCYYTMSDPSFEELSIVTNPADAGAAILAVAVTDSNTVFDKKQDTMSDHDLTLGSIAIYDSNDIGANDILPEGDNTMTIRDSNISTASVSDSSNIPDANPQAQQTTTAQDAVAMASILKSVITLSEKVIELSDELEKLRKAQTTSQADMVQHNNSNDAVDIDDSVNPDASSAEPDQATGNSDDNVPTNDSAPAQNSAEPVAKDDNADNTVSVADTIVNDSSNVHENVQTNDNHTTDSAQDAPKMDIAEYIRSHRMNISSSPKKEQIVRKNAVVFKIK